MPHASSVEDELKEAFPGIDVQLIRGHGGVFEVMFDNNLIYTRSDTGRFPEEGEITRIINRDYS